MDTRLENFNSHGTITGRIPADLNAAAETLAETRLNSITFLNMSGDITITWDDSDEERKAKVIALIRKKMSEGYNFFTTKRVPILGIERKVRVSKKNIDTLEKLVIPDNEFDKLVASIHDRDAAELLSTGDAKLAKRKDDKRQREMIQRLDKAEDVAKQQSLAVKPLAGG